MENLKSVQRAVGQFCRELRVDNGVYQREIGDAVQRCQRDVSAFELGHINNSVMLAYYLYRFNAFDKFREFMTEEKLWQRSES